MERTRYISPFQFAVILAAGYMGFGIFQFPRGLILDAGPDALYALVLEGVWPLVALWLWFRVNRIDPGRSVFSFAGEYITPFFAWILTFYKVALHLALAFAALANFGFVMRSFFLPGTPVWFLEAVTLGVAIYMGFYGLTPLARTLGLSFLLPMVMSVVLGFMLWGHVHDSYAWIPSGHIHLVPIFLGTYRDAYIYFGFKITANTYQFVRPGEHAQAERYGYWAIILTFLFFVYGYFLVLGVEGPYFLSRILWPAVAANRLVSVTGLFINKLGLLVVVFWGIMLLSFEALHCWSLVHDLLPLMKNRQSKTTYRYLLLAVGAAILFFAVRIPNIAYLVPFVQQRIVPGTLIFTFVTPLAILTGYRIHRVVRRRRKRRTTRLLTPSEG